MKTRRPALRFGAAALLLSGLGVLLWALLALRSYRTLTALWVIGALLVGAGAVSVSLSWSGDRPARGLALKILAGVAALLGALWLALVMPARSDAGRTARAFVAHLNAKEYDAAYALLTAERKSSLPRDRFEASLPAPLRSASGFTINGMSTGVGSVVGSETCIDGWLDGASESSGYAFDMIVEAEGLRIQTYRQGACRKH